jgi:hypothetical protein
LAQPQSLLLRHSADLDRLLLLLQPVDSRSELLPPVLHQLQEDSSERRLRPALGVCSVNQRSSNLPLGVCLVSLQVNRRRLRHSVSAALQQISLCLELLLLPLHLHLELRRHQQHPLRPSQRSVSEHLRPGAADSSVSQRSSHNPRLVSAVGFSAILGDVD